MTKPEQKYVIGERVKACGWVGEDYGIIEDIMWIHHFRCNKYCWGYKIDFESDGPGLTFNYIPEGYLRKVVKCGDI